MLCQWLGACVDIVVLEIVVPMVGLLVTAVVLAVQEWRDRRRKGR